MPDTIPQNPAAVTAPTLLHSPLLSAAGIPHAFSTRRGGASGGVFASLNFGNPGDIAAAERDPAINIRANWDALRSALAVRFPDSTAASPRRILEVHQVHGADVLAALRSDHHRPERPDVKADAIVTDDPTGLAAVRTADCTPVLIASADGRLVAAVHAGWRGVIAGVVTAAINQMSVLGADPSRMLAAIGPCIGPDAFEVGQEVASEFHRRFGPATPHVRSVGGSHKSLVDLKGAIREQLLAARLPTDRIDVLPGCTVRDPASFFSHRRDAGRTGRMVGVIGPC